MRKTMKIFFFKSSCKEDYKYKATKARINLDNPYDENYSSTYREKCRNPWNCLKARVRSLEITSRKPRYSKFNGKLLESYKLGAS